jgi:GTPase SAR1 family protein
MYDYLAKIILLGPSGAGKSCILHRFVKNECTVSLPHMPLLTYSSRKKLSSRLQIEIETYTDKVLRAHPLLSNYRR